ncbi:MAG TPA: beta-ketoacyl-ACP synthase III [Spirochaetia bacterium]|nr:beta-ketoacyl-ACP synthase III [Spirochaetales bacterium]HRS66016.1 beta-ketoacyl-ACP synthase III [Spirochaetia bacterium]HOT59676.1 beta-ketoacyl-ACP synthase III [Spirochaetales bacterium]HPD81123.1 beta-ketoacyl-ACP synthase III [Spirochaetales bacterium]HQK33689.1 beta-ketoacyl-ACP synthase III [Spirochaetales bacterium]
MGVIIKTTGASIPANRITNDDLAKKIDTTDEWIRSHTGIGCRHFADEGKVTSDLAAEAGKQALERAHLAPEEIDVLIVATATPDYFGFPSTACLVQAKLGLTNAAAFDITAGCTGFIYGIDIAGSMLGKFGRKRALVIGAETLSRIMDWNDRATCVLFGDGAGAAVLEYSDEEGNGILHSWLQAKGDGALNLYLSQPSRDSAYVRHPFEKDPSVIMNGKNVYMFAVKAITDIIEHLIAVSGFNLEDFAWIVPHQANARIVQAAAKRFGIPETKFYMNMEEYANTSAASVPIAFNEMAEKGLLKKGDLVMTMGFGAGLTYGGTIIRW